MRESVLVTGGAGFIGSYIVDALLNEGHTVRVLDNLDPQVHGALRENGEKPGYLNPEAEFILGDIRDESVLERALKDVDVVFHEAALVGVGQSMYDISRYTSVNAYGAAVLLQQIVNSKRRPRKLIVASSMSIYGEGAYECPVHHKVFPKIRENEQLLKRDWEMYCPIPGCNNHVTPCPTDEDKPLSPTSIYAVNKRDHEEMFLAVGRSYNIPVVALRYFNTYGPRQALSNPYTGVAAIFSSRLMNGNPPVIFEDGKQSRDFVHVEDVAQANLIAMNQEAANYHVYNVGTGRSISISDVAHVLIKYFSSISQSAASGKIGAGVVPDVKIVEEFRAGDIRHCFANITRLKDLGYQPKISFEEGMTHLANWIVAQKPVDRFDQARNELKNRGLTV